MRPPPREPPGPLALPPLPLDAPLPGPELEEYQMKELAYAIFLARCSTSASAGLTQTLRAQLEINETRATELQRITTLVAAQGVSSLASLEMHIRLLQLVRPSAFDSFRNFVRWRDTVTSVVWLVLNQAVRQLWVGDSSIKGGGASSTGDGGDGSGDSGALTAPSAPARCLLARLRGGLRRLDVRGADDYDDGEYSEAAEAVFTAAQALAQHCQTGKEEEGWATELLLTCSRRLDSHKPPIAPPSFCDPDARTAVNTRRRRCCHHRRLDLPLGSAGAAGGAAAARRV